MKGPINSTNTNDVRAIELIGALGEAAAATVVGCAAVGALVTGAVGVDGAAPTV
jgi:hypothetical protein